MRLLLDKKAKIEASNAAGCSPLYYAVRGGHLSVVQLLLKEGANVNVTDNNGSTLLHEAAEGGYDDVMNHLLTNGARVRSCLSLDFPTHNPRSCPRWECLTNRDIRLS